MNRNPKDRCLLRTEIKSLRERLEAPLDEEAEVSELRNNELAPIRRLSDDLLRETFVRCLPSQRTMDSTEAPLLLCHVCHQWREVATDHSLLWTSLKLKLRHSDARYNLRHELVSSWLKRCKGSQVSLQVIFSLLIGERREEPVSPKHFTFLTDLIAHPPLCYFSCLVLYNVPAKTIYAANLPGAFPSLEMLVLSFDIDDVAPNWDELGPISAFRDCPLLRRVALSGHCLTTTPINKTISIPWQQLTHFLFHDALDPPFYSTFLPQMSNLLHSYFMMRNENPEASGSGLSQATPQNIVTNLGSVVSLTVCYWDTESASVTYPNMWRDYDFPNVQSLRLGAFDFDFSATREWDEFKLRSFLKRLESMKKIQTLSLCISNLSRNACVTAFESLPQLTALDLETCDQYRHVLEALTCVPGRDLLPCLKEVAFEVGHLTGYDVLGDHDLEDANIIDAHWLECMVKSRWRCKTERRLRRVVFYAAEQWQLNENKPFVECLRKYGKEGLEVVLICEEGTGHRKDDHHWSQRDKNLRDWPETDVVFNSYYDRS